MSLCRSKDDGGTVMARIRNWGDLNYGLYEMDFVASANEYMTDFVLRLDQPIILNPEIEPKVVENDLQELPKAEIYFDRDRIVRRISPDFIPKPFVTYFQAHPDTYTQIELCLDDYDRYYHNVSMPDNGYDLKIIIFTKEPIHHPDRFLQAFARKLNIWLASYKEDN